jgi:hypothetical protein
MYRFSITGEFEEMTCEDWMDNESWFDIKLLVDVHRGGDYDKSMKNDSYGKAIKQVLLTLGILAYHIVHLGRNLGAKLLEMLEEESEEIRKMGNWNPSIQDASYSTKLPMKPIRNLAGCQKAGGMYYNKRTVVEPPMELLLMTPVGSWVYQAKTWVDEANANGKGKTTAANFLNFMVALNRIFIQDSAAMMIQHPERVTHPVFHMELFRTVEFQVSFVCLSPFHYRFWLTNLVSLFQTFKLKMEQELGNNDSPLDAHLQAVLPGVHHRLEVHRQELACLRGDVGRLTTVVESSAQVFSEKVDEIILMNEEKNEVLGRMHIMVGSRLLGERTSGDGEEETTPPSSPPRPSASPRRPDDCPKYHLSVAPKSFFAIYNEWYGGGPDFEDVPVPGGIAALELKFKARWRKHFEPHEVKEFSRRRMCINAIKVYAEREGVSEATAIGRLSTIYDEEGKKKVPIMANLMQSMGLIEKKARRGKSKNSDEATTTATTTVATE